MKTKSYSFSIKDLTLDEKILLLTGKDSWSIHTLGGKLPEVILSDGPNGLHRFDANGNLIPTCTTPTGSVVANTWSRDMARLDGVTIADEAAEKGSDVLLAPGMNIKRTPLCGRNFEYYSEDPCLTGEIAAAFVSGVQENGVAACPKHFLANNRENGRTYQSSEVDERTVREIYAAGFERVIREKPLTIMESYNLYNGVYVSESRAALHELLREKLGFEGLLMSDWGAVCHGARSLKAGLDLRMPYDAKAEDEIREGLAAGYITEADIDVAVTRILALLEKISRKKAPRLTKEQRHENAVRIAEEGIVLLKNDGILPLTKPGSFFVGGNMAAEPLIGGGGSGCPATDFKMPCLGALLEKELPGSHSVTVERPMYKLYGSKKERTAYEATYAADTVFLAVGGEQAMEGADLESIRLPETAEEFIRRTAEINPNTVVLLYAGSAVDMSAWIDCVRAVVYCGYAGEGVNEATAAILTGKVCPSGKLAETFPLSIEDTYTKRDTGNGFVERYGDGVFVGYRYYDSQKKDVLFPFGYGMSYADFSYSDLKIERLGDTDCRVSFTVKNNSDFPAKEVAELYVRDVFAMVLRPEKELRAFDKAEIPAHGEHRFSFDLHARDFAYYSTEIHDFYVENGDFEILVGPSSRDLPLKGSFSVSLPKWEQFSHSSAVT